MHKLLYPVLALVMALGAARAAEPKPAVDESPATAKQARPDPCAESKRDAKKPSTKAPAKQPAAQSKPR